MTRDFNKQRRDERRPSFREQSSNRYGDERSSGPARPHVNRQSVDRAWESGAPSRHADYRTRNTNGNRGQTPRNNWHNEQNNDQFGQNRKEGRYPTRNTRPSYEDRSAARPDRQRNFDNTPRNNHGDQRPSSRSFNGDRYNKFDRPDRPYDRNRSDQPTRGRETRPDYREHSRPYEPRSSYGERGNGFQQRNRDSYERNGRYDDRPRRYERDNRPFDRDRRPQGKNYRDTRSFQDTETGNSQNPRWQSRPFAQRERDNRREQGDFQPRAGREQYEGDYERFNDTDDHPRFNRRPPAKYENDNPRRRKEREDRKQRKERSEGYEPSVTKLPDGRVLKGPRQEQRKNAEFWSNIADNTDSLLDGVHEGEEAPATDEQEAGEQEPTDSKNAEAKAKPRNRGTSAAARSKIANKKRAKMNGALPRPSRRGYKWPTP